MTTDDDYFDLRNLALPNATVVGCPVSGCSASISEVQFRKSSMPYCPVHRLRIHANTFAYYNGADVESRRAAALRNILFEGDYFRTHFLGNAEKAETHRICHENSEDALTWNVLAGLARAGRLAQLLTTLTDTAVEGEPELYLWGLRTRIGDASRPKLFEPLASARAAFEQGVHKFLTEPDIMLYVPGEVLILIEAKFTSGNTIAPVDGPVDVVGEKPKLRDGVLQRYPLSERAPAWVPPEGTPFYSQLYRNVVFAQYMATKLGVRWRLVNLVAQAQCHRGNSRDEFQDPTSFMQQLFPEASHRQFLRYSWEQLYFDHVASSPDLQDLADYMRNKSASRMRALALP